jgi:hypothetical protein
MPSAQYYIGQARTLLEWARATTDKAYARALRMRAGALLQKAHDARAAVADLNPLLSDFNDRQMRGPSGPDEGAGA